MYLFDICIIIIKPLDMLTSIYYVDMYYLGNPSGDRKPQKEAAVGTRTGDSGASMQQAKRNKNTVAKKKNTARKQKREKARKPPRANGPLDPHTFEESIKIRLGEDILIATLNVQGMKRAVKREYIESRMRRHNIKILAVQETQIATNEVETRKGYIWYFGGSGAETEVEQHFFRGVAIVVSNEFRNYVIDVEPMNHRIMSITLRGTVPLRILSVYAPTAQAEERTKTDFYKTLKETMRRDR